MNKDYTDITIILDRSGSMAAVVDDTIGGFNTFLAEQKKLPGKALLSLHQFDDQYETVHDGKPITTVPLLDATTFVPRGMTALLDAVGKTIVSTGERLGKMSEAERPAKVLLVIITDGHENASQEYSFDKVQQMIKHQQDSYQWQVVFLAANIDANAVAGRLNIPQSKSMSYASNKAGTASTFASVSTMTSTLRAADADDAVQVSASTDFTDLDKQLQKDAGA